MAQGLATPCQDSALHERRTHDSVYLTFPGREQQGIPAPQQVIALPRASCEDYGLMRPCGSPTQSHGDVLALDHRIAERPCLGHVDIPWDLNLPAKRDDVVALLNIGY